MRATPSASCLHGPVLVWLLLPELAIGLAARPKLTSAREGGSLAPPPREASPPPCSARDVVVRVFDISTPGLCKTLSLITQKDVLWFPKMTVSLGGRTWSYDGEVERTVPRIVENAAGGPPLLTLNLGPAELSDGEIDALLDEMGSTDYTPAEYDFFYRNCNHFCTDLADRLVQRGGGGGTPLPREFIEDAVLAESESLLVRMPGAQQQLTRSVTRQVQRVIVAAWRTQWKRALAEYEAQEEEARRREAAA
mmetsp:Transcript_16191/g.51902  ORF Transcript_16191/g.51902 Transcript_16191/m.51902 type:complete len:251 (-) Transcript_16191:24-776(-)